jgi:hypothetical protein
VELRRYAGADHGSVLTAAEPDVLAFLAGALEGIGAPGAACAEP